MQPKTPIIIIAGPTGSGKSALAVELARARNGEVISVDSRQVYRMLDIGTEKIRPEEMQGVPHHLIDIRDPKEPYSAGDFVADAARLIEEIAARGKVPILAGGSHFYFDALLYGLPEETPIDQALRDELETLSAQELYACVQTRDPRRAEMLDPNNARRLIRALEILEKHEAVPTRVKHAPRYEVEWHIVNPPKDELRERIGARFERALAGGLIEEVRAVRAYVGDARLNELGLEYRIVGEYLRGERAEESLYPALLAKLSQCARRQRAWLRKLETERARIFL